MTAGQSIDNWKTSLNAFFGKVEEAARAAGWRSEWKHVEVREDPLNFGGPVRYDSPILILRRGVENTEQRVTLEPKHRFTILAAGRIDVYSYPTLREAMLLRIADTRGTEGLTWDQAEERVAVAPWCAYSMERLPLSYDLNDRDSLVKFISDLSDAS